MTSDRPGNDGLGQVLPGITGAGSTDLSAYLTHRWLLWDSVLAQLGESGLHALGSWRIGQFHLSSAHGASFSDVDAWSDRQTRHREATLLVATGDGGPGLALRLSIHPYDYQQTLSLRAQKVLALLNLAQARPDGSEIHRYHLHKGFLTLSRLDPAETYADTAARLGPAGLHALSTKLGMRVNADPTLDRSVVCLLAGEVRAFTGLRASSWGQLRGNLAEIGGDLLNDRQLSVHPKFRSYLRAKFLGGVRHDA